MVHSSVVNYLSGLTGFLKANGSPGVDYWDFNIKLAHKGLRRISAGGRGKARAIFPVDLMKMFNVLNMDSYNNLLFWCAVTLGYRCLLRNSNICGAHALKIADVEFSVDGIIVHVESSKTNQFGDPTRTAIVKNPATPLCPVGWLVKLLKTVKSCW